MRRAAVAVAAVVVLAGCGSGGASGSPSLFPRPTGHGGGSSSGVPSSRVGRYVAIVEAALGQTIPARQIVSTGRMYCRALRTGAYSYRGLLAEAASSIASAGVSAAQAKVFVDASIVTFCPEQQPGR